MYKEICIFQGNMTAIVVIVTSKIKAIAEH